MHTPHPAHLLQRKTDVIKCNKPRIGPGKEVVVALGGREAFFVSSDIDKSRLVSKFDNQPAFIA